MAAAAKKMEESEPDGVNRLTSFRKTLKQRLPKRSHEAPGDGKDVFFSVDHITRVGGSRIRERSEALAPPEGPTKRKSSQELARPGDALDPSVCQAKLTTLFYELQGNCSTLKELSLQHFGITPPLAEELVQALKYNTVMTKLDLSHNKLGDQGALVLFGLLRENSSITWLDLSHNGLSGATVKKAKKILLANTQLRHLRFDEPVSMGKVRLKKPCLSVEHHMQALKPLLAANEMIHRAVVGQTAVLQMSGRKAKAIPLQILGLTHLMELAMDHNLISYLPPSLSQLRCLKIVDLRSNKLTKVCSEIHHLTRLELLDLSDNLLENLPFSIASLTSLKSLSLSDNRLCSPERVPLRILSLQDCMKNLDITGNEIPLLEFNHMPETLWSEKLPLKRFQLIVLGFGQCGKSTLVQTLRRRQLEGEQLAPGDVQEILNNQMSHKHDVYQYSPWFPFQAGAASAELDLQTSSRQRIRTRLDVQACEVSSGLTGDDERVYYDLARLVMPSKWSVYTVVFRLFDSDLDELVHQQLLWINAIRHASGRSVGYGAAVSNDSSKTLPQVNLRMSGGGGGNVGLRGSGGGSLTTAQVAESSGLTSASSNPELGVTLDDRKKPRRSIMMSLNLSNTATPAFAGCESLLVSSNAAFQPPLPVVMVATYTEHCEEAHPGEREARMAALRERLGTHVYALTSACIDGVQEEDAAVEVEQAVLECTESLEESTVPLDRRFLWLRERLEVEKELNERKLTIEKKRLQEMAAKCKLEKEADLEYATQFLADQGSLLKHPFLDDLLFVNANGIAKAVLLLLANSSLAMSLGEASVISRSAIEDIWSEQFSEREIDACLAVLHHLGLVVELQPEEGTSRLARQLRHEQEPFFLLSILFITKERSQRMHALLTPKPSYKPTLLNYQLKWIPPWMFLRVVGTVLLHLPDHLEVEYIWREGQCKLVSQRSDDQLLLRCPEWQHCFAATSWDREGCAPSQVLEAIERFLAGPDCSGLYIAKETQVFDGE